MQSPRRRTVSQAHKTARYREALIKSLTDYPDGVAVHQSRWDVAEKLVMEGKGKISKPYGMGRQWRKFMPMMVKPEHEDTPTTAVADKEDYMPPKLEEK